MLEANRQHENSREKYFEDGSALCPSCIGIRDEPAPKDYGVFFRAWLTMPLRTGANVPSSRALCKAMANAAAPTPQTRIVELGPGTGTVTRALLDAGAREENLTLVELNPEFQILLKKRFPRAEILADDAFAAIRRLAQAETNEISTIVSSLPLTVCSRQQRIALREHGLQAVGPSGRLVQFTYGTASPVPLHPSMQAHSSRRIWSNIPPAVVWTYQARI